jgi:hypothetical protein
MYVMKQKKTGAKNSGNEERTHWSETKYARRSGWKKMNYLSANWMMKRKMKTSAKKRLP